MSLLPKLVSINTYHVNGVISAPHGGVPYHQMFLFETDAVKDLNKFGEGVLTNSRISLVVMEAEQSDGDKPVIDLESPPCPECGNKLVMQEGCLFCYCGYSRC